MGWIWSVWGEAHPLADLITVALGLVAIVAAGNLISRWMNDEPPFGARRF